MTEKVQVFRIIICKGVWCDIPRAQINVLLMKYFVNVHQTSDFLRYLVRHTKFQKYKSLKVKEISIELDTLD